MRLPAILAALLGLPAATPASQTLPGHVPAIVARLTPAGSLPPTNQMRLAIGLPLRNAATLDALLVQLYNPASTNFHRYLTLPQFTEQFGPTPQDYAAVIAFARSNHLAIAATHTNRLLLDVTGTVADVQRAFHIQLKVYHHPTESRDFFASDTDPSVADGLAIADISGLNNFTRPQPHLVKGNATANAGATPRTGSGSGGTYGGNDFRAAYLPGVTLTGAGQSVGLLEFDGYYASDITAYEATFGLPAVPLQNIYVVPWQGIPTTGASSGNDEVSLDIEMAVAMAPGLSSVVVFEANPTNQPNDLLNLMVANPQISQLSCSWGWGGGPTTSTDNIFKEMSAQGQSFFNASGDSDAFTIGANSSNGVDNPNALNAPSSCPYITVVGGTTLTTTGAGGAWTGESVWNRGVQSNRSYVGTSGGVSSYYAIPSWQAPVSMANNGGSSSYRNTPDVAWTAENIFINYGRGSSETVGGTSCAAPLWAALTALINEQAQASGRPPVGFLNPALYALGTGSSYNACFHDTTTGNNISSSSKNLYYARTGYDLCTGWGTPNGQSLINALAGIPDALEIVSGAGFTASGEVGGPFSPTSTTFILTNAGTAALTWTNATTAAWLTVSPAIGTLPPGSSVPVTAALNTLAASLPTGLYTNTLTITDLATTNAQSFTFILQAGQNLVLNGGFETGDFTDWTLVGNTVSGTLTYNEVASSSTYPLTVHSGNYGAFLGDQIVATLSQTLPTLPGHSYYLSLWLDNPQSGTGQSFSVNWNTNPAVASPIFSQSSPPAFVWTNLTFLVSATGTNTVLQFAAENYANYYGLDDVSVTPIPVPNIDTMAHGRNSFSLTWYATPGMNYEILTTTNLQNPVWTILGTNRATGPTLSFTNNAATDLQRYYRILRQP